MIFLRQVVVMILLGGTHLLCGGLQAKEVRYYTQRVDVWVDFQGNTEISREMKNLSEEKYIVDIKNGTITRVAFRSLDQKKFQSDKMVYKIVGKTTITINETGDEKKEVLLAIGDYKGSVIELLEMGEDFLFTSRNSPFAKMVTAAYRRTIKK